MERTTTRSQEMMSRNCSLRFRALNGTRQRAICVRQIAQQRAFGAGDIVARDVTGEIGGRFDHVLT